MYTLKGDVKNANTIGGGHVNLAWVLFAWLTYPIVLFVVEFLIIKKVPALTKDGRVYAIVMFILVAIVTWGLLRFFGRAHGMAQSYASNKTYSIGIGGAYGIVMMLNVWGIIWPNNKRSLLPLRARTRGASRTGSPGIYRFENQRVAFLPLLLFMGTAHGDWVIFGN